ncbi:unnamed protein product, partial [Onchocerca flexuosa]|uniref:Uncharacterized protein n=1 Tax=Onchocerca flexuosa TaxID=387005 RepID=A0A183HU79_9BILA
MHLSNSIDKLRQSLSLSSSNKTSRPNSTNTRKQYPEKSVVSKLERLKSGRNSTEKVQKIGTKDALKESSDDKIRKLRDDKSSSNHIIDNAIDKTGRSSSKNSRSIYQNLKASKLP